MTAVTEKVTYPVFEGRVDESYIHFKLELEKAFVKNRVAKDDKVKKMRECLRGLAKKLVPESLKDINFAFESLNKAFGDPQKLQLYKTAAIKKLGKLPKSKGKITVEWYMSLEAIIQDIMDLGDKVEDVDIKNALYSIDVVRNIAGLFPENMGNKILEVPGCSRERLENVLAKIVEFRRKAQTWNLNQEMIQPNFAFLVRPYLAPTVASPSQRNDSDSVIPSISSPVSLSTSKASRGMGPENSLDPNNNTATDVETVESFPVEVGAKDPGGKLSEHFHAKANDDDPKAYSCMSSIGRFATDSVSVHADNEVKSKIESKMYEELPEKSAMTESYEVNTCLLCASQADRDLENQSDVWAHHLLANGGVAFDVSRPN